MVFSSNIFLFFFLPLFLTAYYVTPLRWRSLIILIASYIFYAWWRVDFLVLFAAITVWNYGIGHAIIKFPEAAKRWLWIGVVGNLLTLGVFKYFNFGVDSLNILLAEMGFQSVEAVRIILPIGISFHIFQSISFLIDVYRKDVEPARNFLDFSAFIALFPQMVAGPVIRYKDVADQFRHREHSFALFSQGAYRFMMGFMKKVLIADSVAPLADAAFGLANPTMADAWLGALAYTTQLYFDFSGYSDMAIGLALMIGFRFPENFNRPYLSRSITEFWRRWHISLSSWLKDYLYIPLGGNRKGRLRTYINLLLTMLLGGLWHGANWTFVLWGAWHGMLLALERARNIKTYNIMLAMLFIIIGWVMFRAESVGKAFSFYKAMAGTQGLGLSDAMAWQVSGHALTALAAGFAVAYALPAIERKTQKDFIHAPSLGLQVTVIILFIMAVTKLSAQSYSPFLYFQF